jgi:very-short-patch-repair endonuclease
MQRLHNIPALKVRRRNLRASLTPAEAVLWAHVQSRQLGGRKFRRQHSNGRYIVDFYCPELKLAIELDGAAHDSARADADDRARDEFLRSLGVRVLRYENRDVMMNLEGVLLHIRSHFG